MLLKCKKINISRKDLIREYIKNNNNLESTGKIFNCGRETIRKLLIEYNIFRHISWEMPKGSLHSCYKTGLPNCINCEKQLSHYKCTRCIKCSNKGKLNAMHGVHRFGKNSPNYIHGLANTQYPYKFVKIKEKIRNRDNYICQKCGMTEIEHLIVYKTNLHVHHIDYNKENCEENNLITTCCQCNLRANHNRDYWFAYYSYKMENFKCLH